MLITLDHMIFGNGFGDRAPFWDLRVEVSWSLVDLPKDINEANAVLRQLQRDLGEG